MLEPGRPITIDTRGIVTIQHPPGPGYRRAKAPQGQSYLGEGTCPLNVPTVSSVFPDVLMSINCREVAVTAGDSRDNDRDSIDDSGDGSGGIGVPHRLPCAVLQHCGGVMGMWRYTGMRRHGEDMGT